MQTANVAFRLYQIEKDCDVLFPELIRHLDKNGHIQGSSIGGDNNWLMKRTCDKSIQNFNLEMDRSPRIREVLLREKPSLDDITSELDIDVGSINEKRKIVNRIGTQVIYYRLGQSF